MHIAWISMNTTVSELKQPWSVLLQSKNSATFRAETTIIRTENLWSLLKITEHRLIPMKISEHYWKCLRTAEYLWKSPVISENVWISRKNFENYCFNSETVWKPWRYVGALHSWLVFDLCYVDFVRTTFKKNPKGKRK